MIPIILVLAMGSTPTAAYDLPRIEHRYAIAEDNQRDPQTRNTAAQHSAAREQINTNPQDCSSADNQNTAQCEDAKNNQRIAVANEHMVTLTIVIAAVGVMQTLALVLTLVATRKAANATAKSVDLSERSLKITERAHLQVSQIEVRSGLTSGNIPRIVVSIANRGRTPGTIVSSVFKFQIFDTIPESPTFDGETPNQVLVGPGNTETSDIMTQHAVTTDEIEAIKAAKKQLVVWGRVFYLDVFGDRHEMRFGCAMKMHDHTPGTQDYRVTFKQLVGEDYNRAD